MDRGKDHILFPGDCPNEAMVPDAIPLIIRRLSLQTPEQKVSENKETAVKKEASVKKPQPISAAGSTYKTGRKAKAEAEAKKREAEKQARKAEGYSKKKSDKKKEANNSGKKKGGKK